MTSVKGIAQRQKREDKKARDAAKKEGVTTVDSFVNFAQKMGLGADSPLSTASYGFNPISRIRTILEWIHRGSWLGGVAIDLVADDMTREGVDIESTLKPEQLEKIHEAATTLGIWNQVNETIKWARLYGGALAVLMIDGQDPKTPLRIETVGRAQFKGLLVLDRWMVDPSLTNLVTELGPDLGMPKFYTVIADAPALRNMKIHYSRCLRLEGIQLPYWQRLQENLWGISVLERIYDRMVAFDSATTGAAQLVYKAFIRTYKIDGLRDVVAAGGPALDGLVRYVEIMRRFQGNEGITLLDGKDDFAVREHGTFAGLSDALMQFGQQLAGALQIPLVRLFGQSPAGLNSTGESDLRTYYDNIKKQQEKALLVPITRVYRAMAQSQGIRVPDGFKVKFRNLWQLQPKEKADIAEVTTRTVAQAEESGLITQKAAMQELRQLSHETGIFSNITDQDINAASEELPPTGEDALRLQSELAGAGEDDDEPGAPGGKPDKKKAAAAQDAAVRESAAVMDRLAKGLTDASVEAIRALAKRPDPVPQHITIEGHTIQPPAQNITVESPSVTLHNQAPQIRTGDTHVHTPEHKAADVHFHAGDTIVHNKPEVNVPATQVHVQTFPDHLEETMQRDATGEIVKIDRKVKR